MSAAPSNAADEPRDNQELRLRLKREAIDLGGELAAHGARVQLGKITPHRAILEVRQERRDRQDVLITVEDDAAVYTLAGDRDGEEFFDALTLRARILARPNRWNRLWFVAVAVVAWVLIAIGWAIYQGTVQWYVMAGIVVAGTILTVAMGSLAAGGVRAGRRRNARQAMLKRR